MISWIQKYFQQHFRTIFAVLLAGTVISFIFGINASGGFGRSDRRVADRMFFDYNLSLPEDQQRVFGDAQLSVSLQFGSFAGLESEQIQQYALHRAAALHLADTWHIPRPTDDEIKTAVQKLRMFAGQDGQFDAKSYQNFRDSLKTNPRGATESDIVRVVGDDVRVDKVNKLLAGPGYVLPADVKLAMERSDTTWTIGTASASYASFKPEIKPTDADLAKLFEESGGRYDIPPKVAVTYVEFPAANYLAQVQVTDAEVRAYYDANPGRFPKPAEQKPADANTPNVAKPSNPDADFAAVRGDVEKALKQEHAQQLAAKAASDTALALYEARTRGNFALDAFLSSRGLTVKPLAPFSQNDGPKELGGSPDIAAAAFRLNQQNFASDALPTPNGAAILFWKDFQPSRKPQLAEVRDRVAADWTEGERQKRFLEAGKKLKSDLESRLKSGEAFEKAAVAAGTAAGLTVEAKMLAPFSLRNRPQDLDYAALGALENLEKGKVADMIFAGDKGLLVYAADKKLPDLNESSPQFAEMSSQLASRMAASAASAYISDLVTKELSRTDAQPQ